MSVVERIRRWRSRRAAGGNLTCNELVEIVTDYLEGALSASDRDRFEGHIEGCDGCRAYLEEMRQTIVLVGSLLLTAGQKDMRFALPNARIMVHQPSGGFQGQATDIMLHAQEILNLKKRLNDIYVHHTGQPLKKIEDALERDTFLTADMAKDFGLIDKVIEKRPEEMPATPAKG